LLVTHILFKGRIVMVKYARDSVVLQGVIPGMDIFLDLVVIDRPAERIRQQVSRAEQCKANVLSHKTNSVSMDEISYNV
jgi:hypothetical protein